MEKAESTRCPKIFLSMLLPITPVIHLFFTHQNTGIIEINLTKVVDNFDEKAVGF